MTKNTTIINLTKENDTAIIPKRADENSAGADLYANIKESIVINPGETKPISTGISVALPEGTFGAIFARSGLACKNGLRLANSVGVIDSSYRGQLIVALHNDSDAPKTIDPNERIAQLVVIPYVSVNFKEVNKLDETERGEGGFGHSGKF